MNIYEAAKKAMEEGKYITTKPFYGRAKIGPIDGTGPYRVMEADGSNPSKSGWQPAGDDLTREDWMVVD